MSMQQSQKYRNERIITGQYRQLLRRRHEILDFQDGAIIYIHRIPLRNDDGKCIGMPHHRFFIRIELEWRRSFIPIRQNAPHYRLLRRFYHLLYLHERRLRTDEGRKLYLYDALSLRKSGFGTFSSPRRTLFG